LTTSAPEGGRPAASTRTSSGSATDTPRFHNAATKVVHLTNRQMIYDTTDRTSPRLLTELARSSRPWPPACRQVRQHRVRNGAGQGVVGDHAVCRGYWMRITGFSRTTRVVIERSWSRLIDRPLT